jgi:hypothetical protein
MTPISLMEYDNPRLRRNLLSHGRINLPVACLRPGARGIALRVLSADNLPTLGPEAHYDERNHHRRYEIVVGRDLLNDWTVTIRYGRTGQGGQEKRVASPREETAREVIRHRLLRRLSARTRIGCQYRLTVLVSAPGFAVEDWLPRDVMARFMIAAN